MDDFLFTSEAVGIGHPDKVCDQISDAILDACLAQDPDAKVACETLITSNLVVLAGEISTTAKVDYEAVAKKTIREIGYDNLSLHFDLDSCRFIVEIQEQSPDISQGVKEGEGLYKEAGAGDQGIVFGFACSETEELMPATLIFSYKIVQKLNELRRNQTLPYLRPDAKAQVTIEYDRDYNPLFVDTIVLSTQHDETVSHEKLCYDMKQLVQKVIPQEYLGDGVNYYINPTGRFVIGGPVADCGLTGRKTIVDTYGGAGRHGGGAFSGKDPSKVDRSAAYAARYVAKNIVASRIASRCEVQLSYAIGVAQPLSIKVETFGTETQSPSKIESVIPKVFDLSALGIIEMLDLKRPIYQKTAFPGHFGRHDPDFTWERTDRVDKLLTTFFSK